MPTDAARKDGRERKRRWQERKNAERDGRAVPAWAATRRSTTRSGSKGGRKASVPLPPPTRAEAKAAREQRAAEQLVGTEVDNMRMLAAQVERNLKADIRHGGDPLRNVQTLDKLQQIRLLAGNYISLTEFRARIQVVIDATLLYVPARKRKAWLNEVSVVFDAPPKDNPPPRGG